MVRVPKKVMQLSSKVAVLTVTETVLAEAIRAANGDPARLEMVNTNEIIVWNSPMHRDLIRIRLRNGRRNKLMLNSTYGKGLSA
jgi:hypothetical protein